MASSDPARERADTPPAAPVWRRAADAPERIVLAGAAPHFLVHQARFHLGDALWLTPLLRAIRGRFPGALLTAVVPPAAVPLLDPNPHLANLIAYPEEGGGRERRRVIESLSRSGRRPGRTAVAGRHASKGPDQAGPPFDAALFAFARRPESAWLAEWAAAAGVPYRINLEYFDPDLDSGSVQPPATHEGWFVWGARPSPRMLLHALAPFAAGDDGGDEGAPGGWSPETADRRVEVFPPPGAAARAAAILDRAGIGGRPFAVVAPGARSSARWPPERFAALAGALAAEHGLAVVVTGAPEEAALLGEVAAGARAAAAGVRAGAVGARAVSTDAGATAAGAPPVAVSTDPVVDLAALLGRARLLVANDSAPIHLAEAAGTPTLYFAEAAKLVHSRPPDAGRCRALWDDTGGGVAAIPVARALAALREMAAAGLLAGRAHP